MKQLSLLVCALLISMSSMAQMYLWQNGKSTLANLDSITFVPELEEVPIIAAPGAGKVIVAVRAPQGTCNGMIAVGAAINEDGSDDWDPGDKKKLFDPVEGTETWYKVTIPANPGIAVKVVALAEDGTADWGTQWGMNVEGEEPNVTIVSGEGTIDATENGGEVKLTELKENTVVFVDVKAWWTSPCLERPIIAAPGAGKATIAVRVPENTVNGVWLVGGFSDSWKHLQEVADPSLYRFARVEGTKTWWQITVDFDANLEFKFLPICKKADGSEYTAWAVEPTGMRVMTDNEPADDADFNKDNQMAEENAVTYFEVKGWSVDPSVVFADQGAYKFQITLNNPIPAGDVVLTGSFYEQEWGNSKRVMTKVSEDDKAVVYEYEDNVPDYFCFKVFVQERENQTWANGENIPLSADIVKNGVVSYDGFTFPAP